ncbi:acetate--CoA ligase family protein [Actinomadura algeriensis]|uniref:Acyl-CoA synthetase (NDP forming) n=1 Tax=Actinomadura algeriensis TaxID=1679523 RepID=A0ABR9K277_9ACTN|nr:acetate--CoA ligase family protein [Actinomadura algeriensis]MBE1536818.1 acyl-CoA synthetase (NDP forming) [Actinomadura algeriensis]
MNRPDPRVPDLRPLLSPATVAVIGGTSKETGLGARTLRHLREARFGGEVLTPGPRDGLDRDVDVALLCVPAAAAQEVLDRIDGHAKFAVVFASGFEETGGGSLTTGRGTVVLGPNTVGLYHAPDRAVLTFAQAFDSLVDCRHGSGAFLVSQSGAFGARVVTAAARYGFHLDGFIGSGNETHLDACTLARSVLATAEPRVLLLYLEGVRDAGTLHALLADAAGRGVPVVCLLGGLSEAGSTAAASHTAAVSTDTAVTRELFEAYGATLVGSDRELVLAGLGLSLMGRAAGRRAGIVTGSGGAGVVAADLLSGVGLDVPVLGAGLQKRLMAHLPDIASPRNPVDVTAQTIGDDAILEKVCATLRESGEVDLVVVIGREDQAAAAGAHAGAAPPTVVATLDREPAAVRPRIEAGEVVLPDLDSACRVLASCAPPRSNGVPALRPAATAPGSLGSDPTASDSLRLVADAGVEVAGWGAATTAAEVLARGEELGWPVVLKSDVAAGVHKARAGGVRLDVTAATAREAADELLRVGVPLIVARQLRASMELFAGVRRDPQWGPVVSAGLGGAHVELLDRTVAMPAALGEEHFARRLAAELFDRVPGRYDGMAAGLAATAFALADLADRTGAALVECNPLGVVGGRIVALDARVVR